MSKEEEVKKILREHNCTTVKWVDNIAPLICQLFKPKPDSGRLLTDTQIGDLLDLEKEFTYPCSDGGKTTTIDCHKVAQAQRDLTASIKDAEIREILGKMNKRDVGGINPEWALSDKDYQEILAKREKGGG